MKIKAIGIADFFTRAQPSAGVGPASVDSMGVIKKYIYRADKGYIKKYLSIL